VDNPNPLLFLDADLRRAMASSLVEALHRDSPRSTQRRLSVADAETALTAYAEQIKRLAYDERSVRVRLTLHGGAVPNKYRYPAKADWILASVRLEAGNPTPYTLRAMWRANAVAGVGAGTDAAADELRVSLRVWLFVRDHAVVPREWKSARVVCGFALSDGGVYSLRCQRNAAVLRVRCALRLKLRSRENRNLW
jgi:hypothetical protein